MSIGCAITNDLINQLSLLNSAVVLTMERIRGGGGGWIQDCSNLSERKLDGKYSRNEHVQAEYIGQLIEVYETEKVYGTFINQFIEEDHPYSDDPLYDLDMASLGIVKVCPVYSDQPKSERTWLPKKAFYEVVNSFLDIRIMNSTVVLFQSHFRLL